MISSPTAPAPSTTDGPAGPRVMVVGAGSHVVAILASSAREVSRRAPAVRLPRADEFVSGIVNLRGTLVPLVDLGLLLESQPASPSGWMVTLDLGARRCALAVDSLPVLRVAVAPPVARPDGHTYLRTEVHVSGTTLPLLDVDALADDILLQ